MRLSGFPAWFVWLTVHLAYLIGFQNRFIVFLRWSVMYMTRGRGARVIRAGDRTRRAGDPESPPDNQGERRLKERV